MRKIITILLAITVVTASHVFAQSTVSETNPVSIVYPKTVGYFSFILPIVTINQDKTTNDFSDFKNGFAVGFPVGIFIIYGPKFGFSYQLTPTIEAVDNSTKMSNLLFDPGPMFRFKHRFTFIPRLAFESDGRYGFTPALYKTIKRTKAGNYFIAASLPARFGNSQLPSIGGNLQFGLIFN
jgi:hypothetical protein